MAQPYVGEIRMFGGNFAPAGWMFCDGQLLAISENETLFQLIGTTYGGDGQATFALPDLRGRVPVHQGISLIGERYGVESVTLTTPQIPAHDHPHATVAPAGNTTPLGKLVADTSPATMIYADGQGASQASALATAIVGGGQPHSNMMPYQGVSFIISLFGIFPSPI
jgi:microcystin-dependent protein